MTDELLTAISRIIFGIVLPLVLCVVYMKIIKKKIPTGQVSEEPLVSKEKFWISLNYKTPQPDFSPPS